MRWFRDLAISRKLAVTSAALVVSMGLALGTAFILFAAREYRTTTAARVAALAGVIESNSHAAVSFEDGRQAAETLAALSVEPDVDLACMFTSEGRLLAAFPPAAVARCHPRARGRESELTFDRGGVELVRPIVLQGETIGQLAIHRGFGDFRAYMVRQATVGAVVMALGILISLGLAVPLHRFFTEPIERLVATAAQVARGEYSVRATKLGNDELGAARSLPAAAAPRLPRGEGASSA